jgi:hypothetical protein
LHDPTPIQPPTRDRVAYGAILVAEHLLGSRHERPVVAAAEAHLQSALSERLAAGGAARMLAVPRIGAWESAGQAKRQLLRQHRPALLPGAAAEWRAVQRWTFDWFVSHHGEARIEWRRSEGVSGRGVEGAVEELALGELVDAIRRGDQRYLQFGTLLDERPELRRDFDLSLLRALGGRSPFGHAFKLFLGGDGSRTHLHCAATGNLFVMVEGRKRWRLYPATAAAALRTTASRGNYHYSYADTDRLDDPEHPALRHLDGWEVTLEPGDVLFVPPFMWHEVVNVGETIGMSYRYAHLRGALRASPLLTLLRVASTRQPIWRVLAALGRPEQAYQHGWQARGR